MTWRDMAYKVTHETLAKLPASATLEERKAALFEAYPFGAREYTPYRIWRQEVNYALGLKQRPQRGRAAVATADDPRQGRLL